MATLIWLLAGPGLLAFGTEMLVVDHTPRSTSRSHLQSQLASGTILTGSAFLLQAPLTFYGKKLALILALPVAVLSVVLIADKVTDELFFLKHQITYGSIFLASLATTLTVIGRRAVLDSESS